MKELRRFVRWFSQLPWWVLLLVGVVIGVLLD